MNDSKFAVLLGHAAFKVRADLPRDAQELLFVGAVIASALAQFLHVRCAAEAPYRDVVAFRSFTILVHLLRHFKMVL
jgi:hypothetical protein